MKFKPRRFRSTPLHVSVHGVTTPHGPHYRNGYSPHSIIHRLRKIALLVCDVDGVLTDGKVTIEEQGESKQFSIRDGLALRMCHMAGVHVAWVSARPSPVTQKRARELDIKHLVQTTDGKVPAVEELHAKLDLSWTETAFIGDDVLDLAALEKAGLAATPADGCLEAVKCAHFVTERRGGDGAVRELVEKILKAQGKWDKLMRKLAR